MKRFTLILSVLLLALPASAQYSLPTFWDSLGTLVAYGSKPVQIGILTTSSLTATTGFLGGTFNGGAVTATGLSTFDTLKVQSAIGQPNAIQIRRTDNGQAWGIDLSGNDFNINDMFNNKLAIFAINDNAMTGSLKILDANVVRIDSILSLGQAGAQIKAGVAGALTFTGASTFSSTINSGAITATGRSTFDSLQLNGILRLAATQKIRGGDIHFLTSNQLESASANLLWEPAANGGSGSLSIRNTNTGFFGYNFAAHHATAGLEIRSRGGSFLITHNRGTTFTGDSSGNYGVGITSATTDRFSAKASNANANILALYRSSSGTAVATIDTSGNVTAANVSVGGGTAMTKVVSASRVYDCGSIGAGVDSTFSVTTTGAVAGNPVSVGATVAAEAGLIITAECTGNDAVTVRITNQSAGAIDPASRTYKVQVTNF